MRRRLITAVIMAICAVGFGWARLNAQSAKPAAAQSKKTTEQAFKNIQVLKGYPPEELLPAMQFINAALGVECEYCHTLGHFENDDQKTKQIARKMMQMMFAINKENFGGKLEVTCYSCHRGAVKPLSTPGVSAETAPQHEPAETKVQSAFANPLPSADEVLDKYVQALGGAEAIRKISTRVEKGTIAAGGHNFPVEVVVKAPDKRASIMHTPNGNSVTAFDGRRGWTGVPGRPVREMSGSDIDAARLDANLYLPLEMKQMFSEMRVQQTEKIGDSEAVVVEGLRPGKTPVKFYFDRQSGLLVRLVRYLESPLGRMPTQIDYADYRDAGGARTPFRWTLARSGGRFTIQIEQAEWNVPVDETLFTQPAETPTQH